MADIERRILSTSASLRALSQGDSLVLCGYAARFGMKSHPLPDGLTEQIAPGAFKRSILNGSDVRCLFNHDANKVLGRTKSGTLRLDEDDNGLLFHCQLDKNQQSHRDLHAAVKRGDISDCSFAFSVPDAGDSFSNGADENGQPCIVRTLKDVDLFDVSAVTHAAYPNTMVAARAHYGAVSAPTDIKTQIAVWNSRLKQRRADARSQFSNYSPLSAEEIVHCKKLRYSEDTINELRLAAITREVASRAGYTGADFSGGFAANSPRDAWNGGSAADPQCQLRDDDDDFYKDLFGDDDDDAWDQDRHLRAADYHRACARKAPTMVRGVSHFDAATKHSEACRLYPDLDSSRAARAASLSLKDIS
jgi:HK97 family phage prohead protease